METTLQVNEWIVSEETGYDEAPNNNTINEDGVLCIMHCHIVSSYLMCFLRSCSTTVVRQHRHVVVRQHRHQQDEIPPL